MNRQRQKGSYHHGLLSVAKRYLIPEKRSLMPAIGLLAAGVILAFAAYDFLAQRGVFLSKGPLSSAHAGYEMECRNCHQPYQDTPSQQCSACHEPGQGDPGAYSYSAHYVYQSGDFARDLPRHEEQPCSSCHPEHMGRTNTLSLVADRNCLGCHEDHAFAVDHPAFEALTQPERGVLSFPHMAHIREIQQSRNIEEVAETCINCHQVTADGKGFQALDFQEQCASCHLGPSVGTDRLPIERGDQPGVWTLEQFREAGLPGSPWLDTTSPAVFRRVGDRLISKTRLTHKDPWILANLRRLRQKLHPRAGLADLLIAGTDSDRTADLYMEAVASLDLQRRELSGHPDKAVQDDLKRLDTELAKVKRLLQDPYAQLDETTFQLALEDSQLPANATQIYALGERLAKPCMQCHELDELTIRRVQKDQKSLDRARFNHGVHVLQRGCLDCHSRFPDPKGKQELPASVLNLPDIDTCRQCHTPEGSSDSCITCHDFHPNKSGRRHLLNHLK